MIKTKVKVSMFDYAKTAWDKVVGEGVLAKDQLHRLVEEANIAHASRAHVPAHFFIVFMEPEVAHALKEIWASRGADKVYGAAPTLSLHYLECLRDHFFAPAGEAGE